MKNKFFQIKELECGDFVRGFYLCKNINYKITRLGDEYVDLFLEDSTGSIRAKIWSNVNYYKNKIDTLYPVAVKGKVISYNDNLEIDISVIKTINNDLYVKYGYNENLLFKYSNETMNKNFKKLFYYTKLLTGDYRKITENIILKYKDQVLTVPSIDEKYSFKGGFLLQLIALLELNSKIYKKYSLDFDKTITGIIFKNIGLLKYYNDDLLFTISKSNKDKGSKLIGLDILEDYISKKNTKIIDFFKKNVINDHLKSDDIYIEYINNIYEFDSNLNI